MSERPASSISTADGAKIRPLTDGDSALLLDLYRYRDNALVAGSLDVSSADFVAAIRSAPWSTPMALEQDGELVATAMITSVDTHSRNGRMVVLAREPHRARTPLGLYLRHAFWSHPFHRLYAVVPAQLAQSQSCSDLLTDCGFVEEGRLAGHLLVRSRMLDLSVLGLLRSEFDAWCQQTRPGWLLS